VSSLVRDAKLNASEAKHNAIKMALSKTHGAVLFYKEALEAEQVSHNATKAALAAFIDAMDKSRRRFGLSRCLIKRPHGRST
jgi:hypothetical protein